MKKHLFFSLAIIFWFVSCADARPRVRVDGYLHQYNTKWDRFAGTLEVGKVYEYQPNYWKNNLRFIALQVLDGNKVIFYRESRERAVASPGLVAAIEPEQIAQEAYILIETDQPYVDRATLKKGYYICTGTFSYTIKGNVEKTIYSLKECHPQARGAKVKEVPSEDPLTYEEIEEDAFTPALIGLCSPIQVPSSAYSIYGLGLGLLWDSCCNLRGLNLALGGSVIKGNMCGAQLAIGFNMLDEGGGGVMYSFCFNRSKENFTGIQWASYGVNICNGDLHGLQYGGVNYAFAIHGVQLGLLNMTPEAHGLQVAIVNTAGTLDGIQLGLLNFIKETPYVKFFPIANACF